ncbi:MAG TPA: NAD-dependent epimerase/dehydratase family protein [Polyangia bacterium]|jgi:UDP-glucuronate 4-epimerase|nr:NAD-dependent epimerase/dehydratase family protein [Polyangia bacterium]
MRVLVTGAAGFIGSHLSERLVARGDEVVGLDNFDAFYPRAVKERNLAALAGSPRFSLVEGDVRASDDLARAFAKRPDAVVHLAALAGVRPSLADPARYADVNVLGTVRLTEAARARGVRRVVFASSSSVYGLDSEPPFKESDPCLKPLSPYASTKRAGELGLFAAHHLYDLDVTCLRFFTVYGPRQRPDLAIHKFARLILAGKPIELYGDGSTSRDYTWIDDIIDGVVASLDETAETGQTGRAPAFRIYNLGGSRTTTLLGLVELLSDALGKKPIIEWRPEQPGDMKRTLADVSFVGRALGYAPRVPIEEGIARFAAWVKTT